MNNEFIGRGSLGPEQMTLNSINNGKRRTNDVACPFDFWKRKTSNDFWLTHPKQILPNNHITKLKGNRYDVTWAGRWVHINFVLCLLWLKSVVCVSRWYWFRLLCRNQFLVCISTFGTSDGDNSLEPFNGMNQQNLYWIKCNLLRDNVLWLWYDWAGSVIDDMLRCLPKSSAVEWFP